MRWTAVLSAIALVACGTDKGAEAEKRHEMVKRTGTKGELCKAGRAVADTYLHAGNEEKYRFWHTISSMECQNAELTDSDLPAQENDITRQAKAEAEAAAEEARKAALEAVKEFGDGN